MTAKHPNHRYVIIRHPVSGARFASEILIPSGEILRANGPLPHAGPQDSESVENYLVNQDEDANLLGAAWLAEELKKW